MATQCKEQNIQVDSTGSHCILRANPPMTAAAITKLGKGAAKSTWVFFFFFFLRRIGVPHARSTSRERGPWAGLCGPSTKFPTDVGEEETRHLSVTVRMICYVPCEVRLCLGWADDSRIYQLVGCDSCREHEC